MKGAFCLKLKTLKLSGFKSFADKTTIEFQDGMTGIVGPNGSGKSNIIEALRWVLGEQSAKSLRGAKMPDVIFAGSQTRAPLNRAEVELEFDNSDRFLQIDSDQVTITRRIYRNGESEFLINHKNVRLRDIVELFMDTGLGRESFSIISQGKVEAIFNSRPEDRRVLLEEVAGIVKYKKEKQKAKQELDETTDHLDRVADIITELDKQREPLKIQASIARDYLTQKEEYDHYEKSRLVLEITDRSTKKKTLEEKIATLDEILTKQIAEAKKQEAKTQQLQLRQASLEEKLDQDQKRFNELTRQQEKLIGKRDLSEHDSEYIKTRLQELSESIQGDELTKQEVTKQLDEFKIQEAKLTEECHSLEAKLAEADAILTVDPAQLEEQIESLRQEIVDDLQEQATLKNRQAYLAKEAQKKVAQTKATTKRLEQAKAKLAKAVAKRQEIDSEVAEIKSHYVTVKEQLVKLQQELLTAQRLREDQQRRWLNASDVLQRAKARQESLQNVAANYAGYYHGVKAILQAKMTGVVGAVADLLQVPAKLAKAIDTALGAQLQNVVVTDEQAAKSAIRYLTEKRAGRATFLPRTTVKPRELSSEKRVLLQNVAGVIGIASELVEYQVEDRPIVLHLLGALVVAKDLDAATKIAATLNYSVKIVTLAGEVINAGGSLTGGQERQKRTGLLEQQQQLKQLTADITVMTEKLSTIELEGGKTKQKVEYLEKERKDLQQEEQVRAQSVQAVTEKLQVAMLAEKQQEAEVKTLSETFEQTKGTDTETEEQNERLATELTQLTETIIKKKEELSVRIALQKDRSQEQQKQQAQKNKLEQELGIKHERKNLLLIQIKEAKIQLEQAIQRIEKATIKIQSIKEEQQIKQALGTDIEAKRKAVEQEHKELEKGIARYQEKRSKLHDLLKESQQNAARANELRQVTADEKSGLTAELGSCKASLERDLDELAQNYGSTFEAAKQENTETDLVQVKQRVQLLKLGIEELGEVNLGAISEFERIDTRYSFLTQQQADLLEAKAQLVQSMDEMDTEAKNRFKAAFDDVQAAFSEIFPQVFEGGKAELSLTDPNDLLHTGIELMAQPPGKKFQHLNLLSGGERALTAITLLFAILKVRPVPFAVLDEAEAALDDANVARYSRYLRRFDQQTQFIVITHRKGTMMNADVLYGVTMQESGVSKIVSVALDELE